MKVGYVVLYVKDELACAKFWTEQIGMVVKQHTPAGENSVIKVGFEDQDFSLELVPLALMQDNPHGLDLATPSMAFYVDDLEATHARLVAAGVEAMPPGDNFGMRTFAFSDNEARWFAVIQK
jgi:catechol 2,3-dioxygenase-like lactoylglutathione lyase family enzyme